MRAPNRSTDPRTRSGVTLLEVAVSAAVLALVLLAVGIVAKTGQSVYQNSQAHSGMRRDAQRVLDRIVDLIGDSSRATLAPDPAAPLGSSTLDFRRPLGLGGGGIQWGTRTRIAFEYTHEDPNNGRDDEGDGFVDDGCIVLTQDLGEPEERSTVLARRVAEYADGESPNGLDDNGNGLIDEKGLSFVLVGNQLTIRLTLVELDHDAHPLLVTASATARLRN